MQTLKKHQHNPFLFWIGAAAFLFGLFGLRGVIIPSIIGKIIKNQTVTAGLPAIFWIGLIFGLVVLTFYLRHNPIQLYPGARGIDYLRWFLLAAPFLALVISKRLLLDFWVDEVLSITRHIQPSIQNALLWYPVPNNHVFSNAFTGVYIQLLGTRDLLTLLNTPLILRSLYLLLGVLTILTFTYTAHRFISPRAGMIALVLLCTTVPYLNYIVQVRGYSPSLFFASLVILLILQYRERKYMRDIVGAGILAGMMVYTIPSNLYFLMGVGLFFGLAGFLEWRGVREQAFSLKAKSFVVFNPPATIAVILGAGTILFALFYLPIRTQVMENSVVESLGLFKGTAFMDALPQALNFFISGRLALFLIAWAGATWSLFGKNPKRRFLVIFSAAAFLLPFVFSFIRGDTPPERSFLTTLPVFLLLAVLGLEQIITQFESKSRYSAPLMAGAVILFAYGSFWFSYNQAQQQVTDNLINEDIVAIEQRHSALWASPFLDHYSVIPVIQSVALPDQPIPIYIDEPNTRYAWVLTVYMDEMKIPYQQFANAGAITEPEIFVLLSYPDHSLEAMQSIFPNAACEPVTTEVGIYRAVRCTLN